MIRLENYLGEIEISGEYFANLVGHTVSNCFGVAEMSNTSAAQGLQLLLMKDKLPNKGVRVRSSGGKLVIDLHIIVTYGVNIAEIVRSIVHKVSYTVEDATGLGVAKVNVFVDGMNAN